MAERMSTHREALSAAERERYATLSKEGGSSSCSLKLVSHSRSTAIRHFRIAWIGDSVEQQLISTGLEDVR